MERFVVIVKGFQPLTIITKRSILDVAAALDPPLNGLNYSLLMLSLIHFNAFNILQHLQITSLHPRAQMDL